MAKPLPACNRCATNTLDMVDAEPRGVRRCVCRRCSAVVRVNEAGAIVHQPSLLDCQGNMLGDEK